MEGHGNAKRTHPTRRSDSLATSATSWRVDMAGAGALLGDHVAAQLLMPLEQATDLIDFGSVSVNGRQERSPCRRLMEGEEVHICWPLKGILRFYELDPRRIVYRDSHVLAYDKEPGIPSQQTPYDGYNNLFAALCRYLKAQGATDPYAALHHRLDQETSGVMIFALDRSANRNLSRAFMDHRLKKTYLAWVGGLPERDEWVCDEDIGRGEGRYRVCSRGKGKPARTAFRVAHREESLEMGRKPGDRATVSTGTSGRGESFRKGMPKQGRALLLAFPLTGRTHQIRLHLAAAGLPVLGDRLYGGMPADRLYLHAHRLVLPHPITQRELNLTAPVPDPWPFPHEVAVPDES